MRHALALAAGLACIAHAASAAPIQALALSPLGAPGLVGRFRGPQINNLGQVIVRNLAGDRIDLVRLTTQGRSSIVRSGDAVPGGSPNERFVSITNPRLDDQGRVMFSANTTTGRLGLWVAGVDGSLTRAIEVGQTVPGGGVISSQFTPFERAHFRNGNIVMSPSTSAGSVILGWNADQGLRTLARREDAVSGLPPGTRLNTITTTIVGRPVAAGGHTVDIFSITPIGEGSNRALIRTTDSGPVAIAPANLPLPALGPNITATLPETGRGVRINDRGDIASAAQLIGPGVTSTNNSAILRFAAVGTSPTVVLREGQSVPGLAVGSVINDLTPAELRMNSRGTIALFSNTSAGAAFLSIPADGSGPRALLRVGSVLPFGSDTVTIAGVTTIGLIHTNSLDQFAFQVILGGGGEALAIYDPALGPRIIARVGQSLEVAPGESRTIRTISLINGNESATITSGGEDGFVRALTDDGTLTFRLEFTDGTDGIFITAVPAPGTMGLAAVGLLALARRRRPA